MENILFAGGSLGLLLTFFLFNKKENIFANRMLGITFLAYSLDIFYAFYTVTELYLVYPSFIGLSGPLPFVYSPALYLYAHIVCENKKRFNPRYLFHFIPLGLILLAGIIGSFIFTNEVRLELMNPYTEKNPLIIVMRTIIPFYGIAYIILSLMDVKKYHHRLKENFSDIEKLKLNWLTYLIIVIALVWLLELVQIVLIDIAGKPENIAYRYIYAAVSLVIFMVTYKSLKQPEIFSEIELREKEDELSPSLTELEVSSYSKSGLSETKTQEILNSLNDIMEKEKPFLKINLSLSELSTMVGVTTHNLSEVINSRLNKSFYDFVNYYRVEEVKKMLKDEKYKSYSILSVAFEAGFNSKSTFNNIFKKYAGVTPTEFRRTSN